MDLLIAFLISISFISSPSEEEKLRIEKIDDGYVKIVRVDQIDEEKVYILEGEEAKAFLVLLDDIGVNR